MNNDQENYFSKIALFKSLTNCGNEDTAFQFLLDNEWDVIEASNFYNTVYPRANNEGPFSKTFDSDQFQKLPVVVPKKEVESETSMNLLSILGLGYELNYDNYESFLMSLAEKNGLLIIFDKKNDEAVGNFLLNLSGNDCVKDILFSNYSIFLLEKSRNEAQILLEVFKIKCHFPLTLFLLDPELKYFSNAQLIVDRVDGFLEPSYLIEKIIVNSSNIENYRNRMIGQAQSNLVEEDGLSLSELLEKQKNELKQIEDEAEKAEILKKKEEEEKKLKEEHLSFQREYFKKKELAVMKAREKLKNELLPEPSDDNPNKTLIAFRLPNGETIQRKFLKYCRIAELYNFLKTLDNVFEEGNESFNLITQFPLKVYNKLDETLDEAGLFPNSVMQVGEL